MLITKIEMPIGRHEQWQILQEFYQLEADDSLRWRLQQRQRHAVLGEQYERLLQSLAQMPTGDDRWFFADVAERYEELTATGRAVACLVIMEGYDLAEAAALLALSTKQVAAVLYDVRHTLDGTAVTATMEVAQPRFHPDVCDSNFMRHEYVPDEMWRLFGHIFPPVEVCKYGAGLKRTPDRLILSLLLKMLRQNLLCGQVAEDLVSPNAITKRLKEWHVQGKLHNIYRVINTLPGAWDFSWQAVPAPYRPMR